MGQAVPTGLEGRSLQGNHRICSCGIFVDRPQPALPSPGRVYMKSVHSIGSMAGLGKTERPFGSVTAIKDEIYPCTGI